MALPDRDSFKAWLWTEQARAISGGANHTSSPFVFSGSTFIGGCDDTLALYKKQLLESAQAMAAANKVVVITKSWCPYCTTTILLLQEQNVADIKVLELDHWADGVEDEKLYLQVPSCRGAGQRIIQGVICRLSASGLARSVYPRCNHL